MTEWAPRLVEHLLKEWRVIRQAPLALTAAVLLVGLAAWFAMDWAYGSRLETKDATIDFQGRVIGDYERKLDGATPEEAAKKFEDLERQVARLEAEANPRLDIRDRAYSEQDDGTWLLRTIVEVASVLTPNGLLLSFKADGITGLEVKALGSSIMISKRIEAKPGFVSHYVQQPFGRYALDLRLAHRSEVRFEWQFDGVLPGSVVIQ